MARFRRPKHGRWARAREYAPAPFLGGPRNPWPKGKPEKKSWGQAFGEVRPLMLLVILVVFFAVFGNAAVFEPPAFLQTAPQRIEGSFTRCGIGRGYYCVIDGDTFKLGKQSVRVVGIDTAEIDARCPAEAAQAEASTAALQRWLNRGPFRVSARLDEPVDKYGRSLRIVKRLNPDGSEDRLADWMVAEGGARGYWGGGRGGWC